MKIHIRLTNKCQDGSFEVGIFDDSGIGIEGDRLINFLDKCEKKEYSSGDITFFRMISCSISPQSKDEYIYLRGRKGIYFPDITSEGKAMVLNNLYIINNDSDNKKNEIEMSPIGSLVITGTHYFKMSAMDKNGILIPVNSFHLIAEAPLKSNKTSIMESGARMIVNNFTNGLVGGILIVLIAIYSIYIYCR
jgi:hypothetical protein